MLSTELKCPWIDGDEVRRIVGNHDYSVPGRRENIELIQNMAVVSHRHNKYCVVSAVAPFRDQRDRFKSEHNVLEVYLKSVTITHHHVPYYELPTVYFLELDTSMFTIKACLDKIMETITPAHA